MLDTIRYNGRLLASPERGDLVTSDRVLDSDRASQRSNRIGAGSAKFFGRGNQANTSSFTVTRTHANKALAWGYLVDDARAFQALTGAGDLFWQYTAEGVQTRTFKDTVIPNIRRRQRGVTTRITYSFIAGEITTTTT